MSPFDKARYERLLEGLEATEVLLSEVAHDNEVLRCDAEYFGKQVLQVMHRLESIKAAPLEQMAVITDGIHTSLPFVDDGEVKVLSAKHPKDNYIAAGPFEKISAGFHDKNPRTALRANDVLISTVGTIGNAAVVTPDILPANSDRHIGIVRAGRDGPPPFFLSTFLVCRYGRIQSIRETTGNVQPNLFISKIGRLLIPRFDPAFERAIAERVESAYRLRKQAADILGKAEHTLLHALGLDIWTPPEALSYVRSCREAFAAGRFDAEYFHPAKAQALVDLRALSDVCVGDLFESIRDLWQPTEAAGLPVRNYDLTDALDPFLDPSKTTTSPEEIASTKKQIAAGDLVVSRLRSYLREIAVVLPSDDGITAVASTEFIVLRPKKGATLTAEALLIFLRSRLPQIVFKWSQDGSNHPRFDERELLNLPVPRALITDQVTYETAVRHMVTHRQRATRLLDAAKRAVEIAIEDSEAAALAYLAAANPPEAAA